MSRFHRFIGAYAAIPEELQIGIEEWVEHGQVPGHFLQAVIQGDLFSTIAHADDESLRHLKLIVQFFYNRLPHNCWGPQALYTWPEYLAK